MKIMPIVYVTNMPASVDFYERLGLTPNTQDRSGMWFELTLGDAVLALHTIAQRPAREGQQMSLSFVSVEPLETVIERVRDNGLNPDDIVDEAFGRSFRITDPDGLTIQINEHDPSLYN